MRKSPLMLALVVFLWEGSRCDPRRENTLEDEWYTDGKGVNATFKLYTRKNIHDGVTLTLGDKAKLLGSGFQGSLRTVVITHGYNDDVDTNWIQVTRREVLAAENVNVITLDWSECSKNVLYNEVIECMKEVGTHTGKFLKFLKDAAEFNVERAHLIGHSLGAHLMGFAAKVFPAERTIGRITGLDPAGPLFEHAPVPERLNNASAKLVDVIHTCRVFLGMKKPIGTVDFYPNGGYNQVGCNNMDLRCHHSMSGTYFVKTISRSPFSGKRCDTLEDAVSEKCNGEEAVMGYRIQYRTPGIYYVRIN